MAATNTMAQPTYLAPTENALIAANTNTALKSTPIVKAAPPGAAAKSGGV